MLGRRLVVPLVVAGSVAAGGVAGAVMGVPSLSGASTSAATQTKTTPTNGPNRGARLRAGGGELDAAAKALGLTTAQLRDKLQDGKTTIADVAKQQGVAVNKVIDAMVGADRQRIEDFVNHPLPQPPANALGPNAKSRRGFGFGLGGELDAAAKALGVTQQQLVQDLRGGKSIAQIAKDKNVGINNVIDALIAAANKRIDDAQKNGKLTTDQAAKAKDAAKQGVTAFVNGVRPKFGMGHGGPRPSGPPPGP